MTLFILNMIVSPKMEFRCKRDGPMSPVHVARTQSLCIEQSARDFLRLVRCQDIDFRRKSGCLSKYKSKKIKLIPGIS